MVITVPKKDLWYRTNQAIGPWQHVFHQPLSGSYVCMDRLASNFPHLDVGNGNDSHVLNPQGPNTLAHLSVFNSHAPGDNGFFPQ